MSPHSTLTKFIWSDKVAWTSHDFLTFPMRSGGIGLPDLAIYYKVLYLSRVVTVCTSPQTTMWARVEQHSSLIALSDLPWVLVKHYRSFKAHHTINATIAVIPQIFFQKDLSPYPSLMMLVLFNPHMHPGNNNRQIRCLVNLGSVTLHHHWMYTC